ncbi:uncharacterized protein METZ01_LOCUS347332 [marine metagenome]|uniref:Uncharacterized protein n=1 Tax=marine metagenome TaxID=408172 RepID=A0A382RBV0_9ZZZZ
MAITNMCNASRQPSGPDTRIYSVVDTQETRLRKAILGPAVKVPLTADYDILVGLAAAPSARYVFL